MALARRGVTVQVEEGHSLHVDLEEGEIVVGVGAHNGGGVLARRVGSRRRRHQDPDAAGIADHMGVGEDVAIGRDKEAGTTAALGHQNAGGLLVAIFRDFERLGRDLNHLGRDGGGDALRVTADTFQFPSGIRDWQRMRAQPASPIPGLPATITC